jgi:hypothetical protein
MRLVETRTEEYKGFVYGPTYTFITDNGYEFKVYMSTQLINLINGKCHGIKGMTFKDIENNLIHFNDSSHSDMKKYVLMLRSLNKDCSSDHIIMINNIVFKVKTLKDTVLHTNSIRSGVNSYDYIIDRAFLISDNTMNKINLLNKELTEKELDTLTKLKDTRELY